jgi:hypothetical protein
MPPIMTDRTDGRQGGFAWAEARPRYARVVVRERVLVMTGAEDPAAAGSDRILAGHADREQVIQVLKVAFVQCRLTRDELDERASRALTARTRGELAALTADIPADLATGLARTPVSARPSLVQRHPLLWAAGGSGSCLAVAFGLGIFATNVLDPHGPANPYLAGSMLCGLVTFVALIMAIGIAIHGVGTAEEQRRARRQLPRAGPVR